MSEEEDETLIVEKILNKRPIESCLSKNQYLVKWKGLSAEESTWEPLENIGCKALVEEFERQIKIKHESRNGHIPHSSAMNGNFQVEEQIVESVLGASKKDEILFFTIKFTNGKVDILPSAVAHQMYPAAMYDFYQNQMTYTPWEERSREPSYASTPSSRN